MKLRCYATCGLHKPSRGSIARYRGERTAGAVGRGRRHLRAPTARSEILSRLLEALAQAANRDGTTVSFSAFIEDVGIHEMSLPSELPLPIVVVESEDEIGLDWDEDDQRVVSLTIDSSDEDRLLSAVRTGTSLREGRVR